MNHEHMLRRLLVLNDFGYSIENTDLDRDDAPHEFLGDEWLEAWYGPDALPKYVQDELDAVDLLMSARVSGQEEPK